MNIFRKLSYFNASELTVLSFLMMSLVGGIILFYVENNRIVTNMQPVLRNVTITSESPQEIGTTQVMTEKHTFVKPIQYKGERFIDTLFTAVSALCVTGLTSTDFSQFTLTGQIITLILIQMGGLGIIVFTSLFAFAIFRGVSERTNFHNLLASVLDTNNHQVRDMLKYVFTYTAIFEGAGFLIMGTYLQFFADKSLLEGINPWWWAIFHSISAYNNAGFSLHSSNLVQYVHDPVINITIAALIILGGLGYPVLIFIFAYIRGKIFKKNDSLERALNQDLAGVASIVQVRVAIIGTVMLLVLGTVVTLGMEWGNTTVTYQTFGEKILTAFFQSVSTRTAGFNTIDIGALHVATLFLYMGLMFIGANPAGTAGGIKIPTLAVLYGYIKDWFMKPGQPVTLLGSRISKFALSHAIRLFFFSTIFMMGIIFLIGIFERNYLLTPDPLFNFLKVMFEVVSAFGTVGLSMGFAGGVTSFSAILSDSSKTLLIITMLFGRLGPLTILASLPWKRAYANEPLSPDHDDVQKIQIG